jgi:hypothetical protein
MRDGNLVVMLIRNGCSRSPGYAALLALPHAGSEQSGELNFRNADTSAFFAASSLTPNHISLNRIRGIVILIINLLNTI